MQRVGRYRLSTSAGLSDVGNKTTAFNLAAIVAVLVAFATFNVQQLVGGDFDWPHFNAPDNAEAFRKLLGLFVLVHVPARLPAAAWVSAALLLGITVIGSLALRDDRFLTAVGRAAQWTLNKLRRHSRPIPDLPKGLLAQRDAVAAAVGGNSWQAMLSGAG